MVEAENWPSKVSGYNLDFVIGQGSFGLVWAAEVLEGPYNGSKIAIKIIDMKD